jgi:prolyl-tRNA synthetase
MPSCRDTRLLVRAGYIRRAAPGVYTWLPLGLRVLRKVEAIVREEMDAIGGQELTSRRCCRGSPTRRPVAGPSTVTTLFRLQDRKGTDMLLGPTHEEMFTLAGQGPVQLVQGSAPGPLPDPDEVPRRGAPRAGLLRGREFVMKDSYSFDVDDAGLQAAYERTGRRTSGSSTGSGSST